MLNRRSRAGLNVYLERRQIQPVEVFASTNSVNNSKGSSDCESSRVGRCIASHHGQIFRVRGDFHAFGKCSQTMRLRFSLLPRSYGECGWAKYTGSPVAVMSACRAISAPQSQVGERRMGVESPLGGGGDG